MDRKKQQVPSDLRFLLHAEVRAPVQVINVGLRVGCVGASLRYNMGHAATRQPAGLAHACQASGRITSWQDLDFRAQMGWLPRFGLPRWGRDSHPEPRSKI